MIKKFKRRVILVAVSVVTAVIGIAVTCMNVANFANVKRDADKIINFLLQNDGVFPERDFIPKNDLNDSLNPEDFSPEIEFASRYFSVFISEEGKVSDINCDHIATISVEEAYSFYNQVKDRGSRGYCDSYRYGVREYANGTLYVFLYRHRELDDATNFLCYSILFSFIGINIIILLIILLSEFALRPVEDGYVKQRQFITDAGHELKTPLTIISANAEILEMGNGENECIEDIKNQVARLSELTKNLVVLSKLEEGEKPIFSEVNLSDAVIQTVQIFSRVAQKNSKEINLQVQEDIKMQASEENIRRMISLMLDNCIKYSLESKISVKLHKDGKNVVFSTSNATNLPKGNHNRLFERFYRPDSSRARESGGQGIGLSVVKTIADLHKATALAESDGKTLLVRIIFN